MPRFAPSLRTWPVILPFYKYQGLGNDFLIIEREALGGARLSTDQAIALCDRHRGVGADGVLVLDVAAPSMNVINSDGSLPEVCGNGLRCAALHLARRAGESTLEVAIDLQRRVDAEVGEIPFVALVNKSDLSEQWQVTPDELERLTGLGWEIMRTSAKENSGVNDAFNVLAKMTLPGR